MESKLFLVGGAVRDRLLGVPCNDMDYVFVAEGLQNSDDGFAYMRSWLMNNGFTGFKHNDGKFVEKLETLTIKALKDGEAIDVVLAANEVGYIPGTRTAIRVPGSLWDDMLRRDFTLNALAMDENGVVIDFFGGCQDLENRVLRSPRQVVARIQGENELDAAVKTFRDDPLRVIRLLRFAIKLDAVIDPVQMEAARHPSLVELTREKVSTDRIVTELGKTFQMGSWEVINRLREFPEALVKEWLTRPGVWLKPTTALK